MSKEAQITAGELGRALAGAVEQLLADVAGALNAARAGAIIADSEEPVRQALGLFRQQVYERAVQLAADKAAQAAFSPSGEREDGPAGA